MKKLLLALVFVGMAVVGFSEGVSYSGSVKLKTEAREFVAFSIGEDVEVRVKPGSTAEQFLRKAQGYDVRVVVEQIWR